MHDFRGQNVFEAFFRGPHAEVKELRWCNSIDRNGHWRSFLERCEDSEFKKTWGKRLEEVQEKAGAKWAAILGTRRNGR